MIELRDGGEDWLLEGLATTWGQPYPVRDHRGAYSETIRRGAFTGAVTGRDTVALRVEHSRDAPPLASTRGGSMSFRDGEVGLELRATLPKHERDVADAVSKVKRGVIDTLSVGMGVEVDHWSTDRSSRTINSARLHEVSLVHLPANPGAVVTSVRADDVEGTIELRYTQTGLAVVEARREFTSAQLAELGEQGLACYYDGAWHYPTPTRADFDDAVQALGRTPGPNRVRVRKYLIGRAKAKGWPIPDSWKSDGTTKATGSRSAFTRQEIRRVLAGERIPPRRPKSLLSLSAIRALVAGEKRR